jgi:hypothetical protein
MRSIRRRLPSPAIVIAIIALIAALAGTAIAGGVLTTKKFKNQAVRGPVTYATAVAIVPPNQSGGVSVASTCPGNTKVIGGGIKVTTDADQFVNDSHPTATGWGGTVFNFGNLNLQAFVTAICATVKSSSGVPPS